MATSRAGSNPAPSTKVETEDHIVVLCFFLPDIEAVFCTSHYSFPPLNISVFFMLTLLNALGRICFDWFTNCVAIVYLD